MCHQMNNALKMSFLILFILAGQIACQKTSNLVNHGIDISPLVKIDSSYNDIKYTYYRINDTSFIDSIKLYSIESKHLKNVRYFKKPNEYPDKWIDKIVYNQETGEDYLYLIHFEYKSPKVGDTIQISFYPNGIKSEIITYTVDTINYPYLQESFHRNGVLSSKGIYGSCGGLTCQLGLFEYYDTLGILIKTEDFSRVENKGTFIKETEYYDKNRIKSIKFFFKIYYLKVIIAK